MRKIIHVTLNILSLGLFSLYLKNKAKKISNQVNSSLTYEKKYNFSINRFANDLGGIDNIKKADSTLSTLKISLNDIAKVNHNLKQIYKINGISKSKNNLLLIFGNNSMAIAKDLNNLLENN